MLKSHPPPITGIPPPSKTTVPVTARYYTTPDDAPGERDAMPVPLATTTFGCNTRPDIELPVRKSSPFDRTCREKRRGHIFRILVLVYVPAAADTVTLLSFSFCSPRADKLIRGVQSCCAGDILLSRSLHRINSFDKFFSLRSAR